MTEIEYVKWTEYHRDIFQMKSSEDASMFGKWLPSLAEFSIEEAKSASLSIASDDRARRFRTEHLSLLRAEINHKRTARRRDEYADADMRLNAQKCRDCDGTGTVSVPHVGSIVNESWAFPFASMIVACNCNIGINTFNFVNSLDLKPRHAKGAVRVKMIDLKEYEYLHPEWRSYVDARNQQRKSENEARWHAQRADRDNPLKPVIKAAVLAITQRQAGDEPEEP